ncbi:MAG: tRNA (pseudouridine(54)-N(1))-methyltransferase TrmY [Candidatus Lutacidiplasmatales archaeon]
MRRFLFLAHRVPTDGQFTLNDLAGGAGRMDEVARAVSNAFTLSNDLRRDTEVSVLFVADPPPKARRIDLFGGRLRFLNPDERSTAALLKNALVRSIDFPHPFESSPGLVVSATDPMADLRTFVTHPNPVWLSEDGPPIEEWLSPGGHAALVVSDPYDPTAEERELLTASGIPRASVGPRSLRTSQVVDLVHHELDLREAGRPPRPTANP